MKKILLMLVVGLLFVPVAWAAEVVPLPTIVPPISDCVMAITGATVGFASQLGQPLGITASERYGAFGLFTDVGTEKNADGETIFWKYFINQGFAVLPSKCYSSGIM